MEEQNKPAEPVKEESAQQTPSEEQPKAEPQAKSVEGSSEKTPSPKTEDKEYAFNGNWAELEEQAPGLVNYAKGVRKYLTKQSEQIAQDRDKVEKFNKLEKDPELTEFIEWKKAKRLGYSQPAYGTGNVSAETQPTDPNYIDPDVQRLIAEKERIVAQDLNVVKQELAKLRTEKDLDAFAEAHPQFWELHKLGLMAPQLEKIRQSGKGTYMDAYNAALDIRDNIVKAIKQEIAAKVNKKKNASSAKPTSAGEPDIEYITDKRDYIKRAFDLAAQGQIKNLKFKKQK